MERNEIATHNANGIDFFLIKFEREAGVVGDTGFTAED